MRLVDISSLYALTFNEKRNIMAKSQDAKKKTKKEPTRTAAEKKALKREKKNNKDK